MQDFFVTCMGKFRVWNVLPGSIFLTATAVVYMVSSNISRQNKTHHTLRIVGFSYSSRERNYCEHPLDFPSSMCEVRHTPRDAFNITSYFAGKIWNKFTVESLKRNSNVAKRTRNRQNKFTNSFYWFKFNLFVHGAGQRLAQRNLQCFLWFLSREE